MTNNYHIIIPARMNSTRLSNKMLLDLAGEPIVIRTAKQALKTSATSVTVATDHPDILKVCQAYKINCILTSDKHVSGTERIVEAVQLLNLPPSDYVINVQGDEPLISPSIIDELAWFIHNKKTTVATMAHKITSYAMVKNPNIVKIAIDKNDNALYFSRAKIPFYRDGYLDDIPVMPEKFNILRHIGIYAYQVNFLHNYPQLQPCELEKIEKLEQLRILYNDIKIAVLTTNTPCEAGIDTQIDLDNALKALASERNNAI